MFTCILVGAWFLYTEMYTAQAQFSDFVSFSIQENEPVDSLAKRLEQEHIVRSAMFFKLYARVKGIDRQIRQGEFQVEKPITLARVVVALSRPAASERTITIIPGWDLRDVAEYLKNEGVMEEDNFDNYMPPVGVDLSLTRSLPKEILTDIYNPPFRVLKDKSWFVSYEGYLAPDTYRVFKSATAKDILLKLIEERDSQFTEQMYADIEKSGHTVHEILTMASIIEREVRSSEDRKIVSDLFWRRLDINWALQADSTVHYAVNKKGNVFTTSEDRDSLSAWNTYKYPGLPPGPISNPSLDAIMAAMYPEKNEYWYFMTTPEGEVKYGKTLEEHNQNVNKYLR
ncbi:MAG: endolytic transglycosylase MltG [Candidatus Magasanikbacteria bacterium]